MVIMLSKESSIALIANHVGNILQLRWTQGFLVSIEFDTTVPLKWTNRSLK